MLFNTPDSITASEDDDENTMTLIGITLTAAGITSNTADPLATADPTLISNRPDKLQASIDSLTVARKHLFSRMAPQQPKKPTMKMMTPSTMTLIGIALTAAGITSSTADPLATTADPTPISPRPASCRE